jgi:hypothetical protein
MATPGELVEVMATALGVPVPTVVVHDRNLVVAGLRSKGGRGRSAAHVNERDAAHLLTALLASAQVRDTVHSVKRYGKTRCLRRSSGTDGYKRSGIKELSQLPVDHSFVDALEALILAAGRGAVPKDAVIEVAALSPGTIGDIRIAGLANRSTVHGRYALPSPWSDKKEPTEREIAAWEGKMKKEQTQTDLEQYRRVSARTIFKLGETLAHNNKGGN